MVTETHQLIVNTHKEGEVIDITKEVQESVRKSQVNKGIATVFLTGSTAAVTTIEYELGLVEDFPAMLARIAPRNIRYEHEEKRCDGNGHSHVKASLLDSSITVPIVDGHLTLGTWQQLVLVKLDVRSRLRKIIVQIIGE